MRILYVSHFLPYPPHGGALQRNFNLIRELAKSNEVHLITFTQRTLVPTDQQLNEGIEALRQYCKKIKVFPIASDYSKLKWYMLLFLNLFSTDPYSVWRFRSKEFTAELARFIKSTDYDLVHVDTIALAEYINSIPDIPKVLNHHNVESRLLLDRAATESNPFSRLYIHLQGTKLRNYEKKYASRFNLNIVVSEQDKDELSSFVPNTRFEVIANGTDTVYFTPGTNEGSCELVYAGGMTWYPNRDAMTYFCQSIFSLIKEKLPNVVMNIIGRKPPAEVVEAAEADPSIKALGYVDDIRGYLEQAAVYVVPIRVGGGSRLKILDAFAAGKAVVSTTVGCSGINVTPGEDILIADTPEEFANQVFRLIADPDLRKRVEEKARELIESEYSWTIIGRNMNLMYSELSR